MATVALPQRRLRQWLPAVAALLITTGVAVGLFAAGYALFNRYASTFPEVV